MARDARLVHHIDSFVGQVAIVDIARGKLDRRSNRGRRVTNIVMFLVMALEPIENLHRFFMRRFIHLDPLEAPRQGLVAIEGAFVLLIGGRPDTAEIA